MIKLCIFDTFEECKEAENYDHNYQKAIELAMTSGVDLDIIRQNNLHIQNEENVFLLDVYMQENNIEPLLLTDYLLKKSYWSSTKFWSLKYKLNDKFVYFKDHSDRTYNIVEVEDLSQLKHLDEDGNEIETT
jgi:hypothetical protein